MRANIMDEAGDIIFEDLEGLLREIGDFSSSNPNKPEEIPQSLEGYLSYVAKTGNTVFPWQHVRLLFRNKILQAMDQFPGESCPNNELFVMERFDMFRSAPFTIQRLAELITQPNRHYKKKGKFLNGLEKTVLVVSTVEPWSVDNDFRNGNDDGTGSDGEMDQTYSESDEGGNRSFDSDQQENVVMSDGQGDGSGNFLRVSTGISISLDNVTTTMVNITSNSNGSQSTAAIMTSATAGRIEEMATSELGLSAVVTTNEAGATASLGEQGVNQVNDNFLQMEENRLSDIVVTTGISGETFVAGGGGNSGAVLQGLELTSVEVGVGSDNKTEDSSSIQERTLSNVEGSTLQVEHVEVQDLPSCQITTDAEGEGSLESSSENAQAGAMDVEVSVGDSEVTEKTVKDEDPRSDTESLISTAQSQNESTLAGADSKPAAVPASNSDVENDGNSSTSTPKATTPEMTTSETKSGQDQIPATEVPVVADKGDSTLHSAADESTVGSVSPPPNTTATDPVPEVLTTDPPSSE